MRRRHVAAHRMQLRWWCGFPREMSGQHMELSRDGSMLELFSPAEDSALPPMLYVQRIGSPSVTILPGNSGAQLSLLVPDGTYVAPSLPNGKLQKDEKVSGGSAGLASVCRRARSWGSRRRHPLSA